MLCAHTIRRLKPGTFDEFVETFTPPDDAESHGWVRFHVLRRLDDPDEVITFGFFDGSLEEMDRSQLEMGYSEVVGAIQPLVDEVLAAGVYEVTGSRAREAGAAR